MSLADSAATLTGAAIGRGAGAGTRRLSALAIWYVGAGVGIGALATWIAGRERGSGTAIGSGAAGTAGAAIAVWMGNFLGVIIVFIAGCIWLVPAGIFIWSIYRTVVGWLALSNNKPA